MNIQPNMVILTFDRIEQEYELYCALKGVDYRFALQDIANDIFRPARKHGYPDEEINNILNKINDLEPDNNLGEELVSLLEKKFYNILRSRDLEIYD